MVRLLKLNEHFCDRKEREKERKRKRERERERENIRQQKAVWDSGSLALLIEMSVKCIILILRCVQGSSREGDDVL